MRSILCCLVVILSLLVVPSSPTLAKMSVHFIDVKQGGGVLIEKDGKIILYDCGDTFAGEIVTKYLEALGVKAVDMLIVSHAHRDHMGGCLDVLDTVTVKKIFHNGSDATTKIWIKFLRAAKEKGIPAEVVKRDEDEGDVHFLVAYDTHEKFSKEADNSLLTHIQDGQVSLLLTGDCEKACEKELIRTSNVHATILSVGHHGSKFSSSIQFLEKVRPQYAIIQAGAHNPFHHPTAEALSRLRRVRSEIHRTDYEGSIVLYSDGHKVSIETEQ